MLQVNYNKLSNRLNELLRLRFNVSSGLSNVFQERTWPLLDLLQTSSTSFVGYFSEDIKANWEIMQKFLIGKPRVVSTSKNNHREAPPNNPFFPRLIG